MRTKLLFAVLVITIVGCTDSIDTVTREYRNTNNEVIDALMRVTDEASAAAVKTRVIDPSDHRYRDIDGRLKIVRSNRTKKEFVKETLESDGFQLYLTDLEVNRQRLSFELARLRKLVDGYVKDKRQELDGQGLQDQPVNVADACPNLHKLVYVEGTLRPILTQLTKPDLLEMTSQFGGWKVDELDKMLTAFNAKRTKTFQAPPVKLIE
jgi:hypothetical protein